MHAGAIYGLLLFLHLWQSAIAVSGNASSSPLSLGQFPGGNLRNSTKPIDLHSFITDDAQSSVSRQSKAETPASEVRTLIVRRDSRNSANLTISKCALRWGQVIGRWDFFDGTTRTNATYVDIYRDTCQHAGLDGLLAEHLNNRVFHAAMETALANNLNSSRAEAMGFLNALVPKINFDNCFTHKLMTEDDKKIELRKLLQDGFDWSTFISLSLTIAFGKAPDTGRMAGQWLANYNNHTMEDAAWIDAIIDKSLGALVAIAAVFMAYIFADLLAPAMNDLLHDGADQLMAAAFVAVGRRDVAVLAMINGLVNAVTTQDLTELEEELDSCSTCLQTAYDVRALRLTQCGVEGGLDFAAAKLPNLNATVLGFSPIADIQASIQAEKDAGTCPAQD